jgi:phosphoribosylglycinamide formyltransferase-1
LREHDPRYGIDYGFVGVFCDVPGKSGVAYAREAGIPTVELDFEQWRKERGISRKDLVGREPYFAEMLRLIAPWDPQAIMLSGFMLIVTNPLYSAYAGRMLNVHPALLSLLDEQGRRKYRGIGVVDRAMKDGAPTGSTVHILTEEPDMGPIVAESAPLPYQSTDDPASHQDRMKTMCDGPAFQAAFGKLITSGWPQVPWQTK